LDWLAATSGIEQESFFLGFGTALTAAAEQNVKHSTQKKYLWTSEFFSAPLPFSCAV
jgi:hypothetical protein